MRDYLRLVILRERQGPAAFLIRAIFWLFAFIYSFLTQLNNWFYTNRWRKIYSLPRPVVSVGNITWGGTGKTPLVSAITSELVRKNFKPAILLRGYMPSGGNGAVSDEAVLLEAALPGVPVLVGKNRYQIASDFLKNANLDILLLDDGFQHRRLARNVDIVVIDTVNPFGSRRVFPAGILRESLSSLRRADVIVLSKCDLGRKNVASIREEMAWMNPGALVVETSHVPAGVADLVSGKEEPVAFLKDKNVVSLCAIGSPESFAATIQGLGAKVARSFVFPDHHRYAPKDFVVVQEYCRRENIGFLLTTEKDAVKLRHLVASMNPQLRVLVLKIKIEFLQGKEEFFARIFSLLQR